MICGKVPCLSQKMMIYYKMAMSGVYENVFQTSKNYLEGAKISFWNCKVWGGGTLYDVNQFLNTWFYEGTVRKIKIINFSYIKSII